MSNFPDISPELQIFDRAQLRHNRNRCARTGLGKHGFLIEWCENELLSRLNDIKRDFPVSLQIGARRSSGFPNKLKKAAQIQTLLTMDMAENSLTNIGDPSILGHEETLPFARNTLDMVLSTQGLHSVSDLPGALTQINQALKPDGLFLGALFGGETLHELRQALTQAELTIKGGASPRVMPFADKRQMGELLGRAGFALPVIDSEILHVTYDTMFDLLKDIRGMGEGNIITARDKRYVGRDFFMEAARYYAEHFSAPDGRIRARFEVIFLIGWSPHESQPQPLKRGSATHHLADVL